VFATDPVGNRLPVRKASNATSNSIVPSVLNEFLFTDRVSVNPNQFPAFLGGDSQILFNVEYRIPIIGPLQFAPFFDIGSVFNLIKLEDQSQRSEFINNFPNAPLATLTLNPRGQRATQREINNATTPETPPGSLPPGFKNVLIFSEQQTSQRALISQAKTGVLDNYRMSMGGEFRIQVPVINVPFRLIFALNPNARTDNPFFFEQKKAIRFSVGRTF
jgi:outer membrane protein insertion porin family